jgi:hypothetical protein
MKYINGVVYGIIGMVICWLLFEIMAKLTFGSINDSSFVSTIVLSGIIAGCFGIIEYSLKKK